MRNLSKRQTGRAGISLVELVVAVALLSLVSLAAVQLMNMTERTMIGSQTNLNQQLRSESIASYIFKDFARGELGDDIVSRTYRNDNMPEDLRDGTGVTVVSPYGKASRFSGVDPRCPLERTADPATGTFRMPANCMTRGGQTIVQQMNDLIGKENTWSSKEYSCDSQSQNIPVGKCQPSSGMPGEGVAIYGHKDREGTWFSVPAEAQKCDATREHSICGYYVEFEEPEGENPVKFAHQVTLDMRRFREFCQSSNQPAG